MDNVRIGFVHRLLAAVVDCVVVIVLTWVPTVVLGKILGPAVGAIIGGGLALAYYSLEVLKAQSVGKMIFKFRITKQDGSPADRDQLLRRYAFKQVPQALLIVAALPALGFVSFVAMIAAVAVLVSALMTLKPEKLAYHDQLFGTAVYGPAKLSVSVPTAADLNPAAVPTAA